MFATPREAVDDLLAKRLFGGPASGRRTVKVSRGTVTLRPLGARPAATDRFVEREEVEIEGPLMEIDPSTITFLKEREVAGRHLFAVSFEQTPNAALGGRRHETRRLVIAEQTDPGWRAFLGAGIGAGRRDITASAPQLSLGVHWSVKSFSAAAEVDRTGAEVAAVRLRFPDGGELEADTDDDLVLFFAERPLDVAATLTVELLDASGNVVATQTHQPFRHARPGRPPAA